VGAGLVAARCIVCRRCRVFGRCRRHFLKHDLLCWLTARVSGRHGPTFTAHAQRHSHLVGVRSIIFR